MPQNNTNNLTLLGTIHMEPKGTDRLWSALKALQPDAIVIEHCEQQPARTKVSPELMAFITENKLQPGYEVHVPMKYCEEANIHWYDADVAMEEVVLKEIVTDGLHEIRQMATMSNQTVGNLLEMMYGFNQQMVDMVLQQLPEKHQVALAPAREERMCGVIREVCGKYQRVVFICGLFHTFSLAGKLADLKPVIRKLNEFDQPEPITKTTHAAT